MSYRRWGLAFWLALLCWSGAAQAGRTCDEPHPPTTQSVVSGLQLAERTLNSLEASGARVVLLARAGQDLSQYGLRYSHLGIAYQQNDSQGGHVWRVLHKLNECGSPDASIYRQGLGEFFLDSPWRYEAAWVAPTPEVQARLLAVLQDPQRAVALHTRPYSVVSYVWGRKYQQSNQWVTETFASAMEPGITTREQAQAWLRLKDYRPSTLKIGAMTRLGARMTRANVAFDDHPNDKRFSDQIDTTTVDSVFSWLQRAQLGAAPVRVEAR